MKPAVVKVLIVLILVVVAGRFFLLGWHHMALNSNSEDNDQGGYLYMGLALRETGMLSDGIRGPLFPALIAPLARYDWDYFTLSKYLCVALGIVAVWLIYAIGRRLYDRKTALAAAFLFGVNINFIQFSAFVLPETILVILFFLAWVHMSLAIRRDRAIHWALAGLFAALAFHAKGTGQLMMVTFLVAAVLLRGFGILRSRNLWILVGAYLVVASPLYMYNAIHFGSPTFNWAITHQMWMEEWRDWYNIERRELPTMMSYVRSHSLGTILQREINGLLQLRFILVKAIYPARDIGFDRFLVSLWSGATIAVVAAVLVMLRRPLVRAMRRHREETVLAVIMCGTFYVMFAWYFQVVYSIRFMLPLVPLILLVGCNIGFELGGWVWRRLRFVPLRVALAAVLALVFVLAFRWVPSTAWQRREAFTKNVFGLDAAYNSVGDYPFNWLRSTCPRGTVIAKANLKSAPVWRHMDWFQFRDLRDNMTIDDLNRLFEEEGADYVFVQKEMSRYQQAGLDTFFAVTEEGTVDVRRIPPGWALTLPYPQLPCRWCVFRLIDRAPLAHATDYRFADGFELRGYQLTEETLHPGNSFTILLHWRFPHPTERDLTVFTQLIGPDGRLYGQQDNPPLGGTVHTTRLPPDSHLVDRYDIQVADDAAPGEYLLLVGAYDPATGERRSVFLDGQPLPDHAIPLASLRLDAS